VGGRSGFSAGEKVLPKVIASTNAMPEAGY
jgi:hypothetical protein